MRNVKTILAVSMALLIGMLSFGTALADGYGEQTYSVTITNLTKKQVFSPPLVVSHKASIKLFEPGQQASQGIVDIAEAGDTATLIGVLGTLDEVYDYAVGGMMLPPGQSMTLKVKTRGRFNRLSLVGMLVSSNDAFYAINSSMVPYFGMKKLNAIAYDAGSEANTELCEHVPGPPCAPDSGNDGIPEQGPNPPNFVHVHNGIHGVGDLSAANMTWLNPVAKVTIKKMR